MLGASRKLKAGKIYFTYIKLKNTLQFSLAQAVVWFFIYFCFLKKIPMQLKVGYINKTNKDIVMGGINELILIINNSVLRGLSLYNIPRNLDQASMLIWPSHYFFLGRTPTKGTIAV